MMRKSQEEAGCLVASLQEVDRERIEGEDGLVGLEIVVERGKIAEARSYLDSGVSYGEVSLA